MEDADIGGFAELADRLPPEFHCASYRWTWAGCACFL